MVIAIIIQMNSAVSFSGGTSLIQTVMMDFGWPT